MSVGAPTRRAGGVAKLESGAEARRPEHAEIGGTPGGGSPAARRPEPSSLHTPPWGSSLSTSHIPSPRVPEDDVGAGAHSPGHQPTRPQRYNRNLTPASQLLSGPERLVLMIRGPLCVSDSLLVGWFISGSPRGLCGFCVPVLCPRSRKARRAERRDAEHI